MLWGSDELGYSDHKRGPEVTVRSETYNDTDNKTEDVNIKMEDIGSTIEEPDGNKIYLNEYTTCFNATDTHAGCSFEFIKVKEEYDDTDPNDKLDDIDIKIENSSAAVENSEFLSAYLSEDGKINHNESRECWDSRDVENSQLPEQTSDNNLNKYGDQSSMDNENGNVRCSLLDDGCTGNLTCNHKKSYKYDPVSKGFIQHGCIQTDCLTEAAKQPTKVIECDVCNKRFIFPCDVARHRLTHTEEMPFTCEVCNKRFTQLSYLTKHKLNNCSVGEKFLRCDVCNKLFTFPSDLTRHKLVHTGEKRFKCGVCSRAFLYSSDLERHKLTHTKETPFACDICHKGFRRSSNLISHKLTHTGEKPYQCDVCNRKYTSSSNLTRHRLTHTGEKPHKCDVCNKGFTQLAHLGAHRDTHIGEKT